MQIDEKYLPILKHTTLFNGISPENYPLLFDHLHAQIRSYPKDEVFLHIGDSITRSGIVLEGMVEGSFLNESYNRIRVDHFSAGRSFAEAFASVCIQHSPIQLRALEETSVLWLDIHILTTADDTCPFHAQLASNLIRLLASQNIFSNLKLRISNQKDLRDKVLLYLHSLTPDTNGFVHLQFSQTALAEFLGVNRSALSRELGRMQDEGILTMQGSLIKLL